MLPLNSLNRFVTSHGSDVEFYEIRAAVIAQLEQFKKAEKLKEAKAIKYGVRGCHCRLTSCYILEAIQLCGRAPLHKAFADLHLGCHCQLRHLTPCNSLNARFLLMRHIDDVMVKAWHYVTL